MTTFQGSLFASGRPTLAPLAQRKRVQLDATSWVDHLPSWVGGADDLFADLVAATDWVAATRPMYDRIVAVPRLTSAIDLTAPTADGRLVAVAAALTDHYGEPLTAAFANYYRDGTDSVAWHADRVGRHHSDPTVVIVSLGAARRFLLRPAGGGPSIRHVLRSGDLLVMGGACQHRWEHSVPKATNAGPRLSVTLRRAGDHAGAGGV